MRYDSSVHEALNKKQVLFRKIDTALSTSLLQQANFSIKSQDIGSGNEGSGNLFIVEILLFKNSKSGE